MVFNKLRNYFQSLLRQSLVKTIIQSVLVRGIGLGIAFIGQVYIARKLGPETRGTYSAILALVAIGAQVFSFGLQNTNTYVIAKDPFQFNKLFSLNVIFLVVLAFIGVGICYPLWAYLSFPVEKVSFSTAIYAMLLIISTVAFWLMGQFLFGLSHFRVYNLFELVSKVVAVIGVFLLGFGGLLNLNLALLCGLVGLVLGSSLFAYATLKKVAVKFSFDFDLRYIFTQAGYSGRIYLSMIFGLLILKIDVLIVERILGDYSAGIYSVASSLSDLLLVLPVLIAGILFPKIRDSKTTEEAFAKVNRALRHYCIPLFLGITVFFFVAGDIINFVYGQEYADSAAPMRVLAWAVFFMSINNYYTVYLSCVGSPWSYVFTGFCVCLLNFFLNLVAAGRWGVLGVAYVSLLTYFIATLVNFLNSYRISQKKAAL